MRLNMEQILGMWDQTKRTPFAAGRECDPKVLAVAFMRSYDVASYNVLAAMLLFPNYETKPVVRLRMRSGERKKIRDVFPDVLGKPPDGCFPTQFLSQVAANFTAPDDPDALQLCPVDGDVVKLMHWLTTLELPTALYEWTIEVPHVDFRKRETVAAELRQAGA